MVFHHRLPVHGMLQLVVETVPHSLIYDTVVMDTLSFMSRSQDRSRTQVSEQYMIEWYTPTPKKGSCTPMQPHPRVCPNLVVVKP